jgi:hypothetical protein
VPPWFPRRGGARPWSSRNPWSPRPITAHAFGLRALERIVEAARRRVAGTAGARAALATLTPLGGVLGGAGGVGPRVARLSPRVANV